MFSNRMSTEFVDAKRMNELLRKIETKNIIFEDANIQRPDGTYPTIGIMNAYLVDGMRFFTLTARFGKVKTYILDKTGEMPPTLDNPGNEWKDLNRHYYKVPHRSAEFKNAGPLLWTNPAYDKKRSRAWGYDMNDAYASIMMGKLPDTSVAPRYGIVEEGEIGFSEDGELRHPGRFAFYIFPLIDSPLRRFAEIFHSRKVQSLTPEEKARWKHHLTDVIGYMGHERVIGDRKSRINPFIRNYVVLSCNERMLSLMDENTIMVNTDSIVSAAPREDLTLGSDAGEFKLEHCGNIGVWGYNYQWDYQKPLYRGIPKKWFPKGWDIIKDELPGDGNRWIFDREKMRIVKNKEETK